MQEEGEDLSQLKATFSYTRPGGESKKPKLEEKSHPEGLKEKLGSNPLRLIIVGHNPSQHAWTSGHYYSNPSNRMWTILISTGIAPPAIIQSAADDDLMIEHAGVGFTDIGCGTPGTDSSQFKAGEIKKRWTESFLNRLREYLKRANESIGCECGECGAPYLVAFSGKTQFLTVYNSSRTSRRTLKKVSFGKQTAVPEGWPFPGNTEVWVLPSTSGASALTNEDRVGPYKELSERLKDFDWPESRKPRCL